MSLLQANYSGTLFICVRKVFKVRYHKYCFLMLFCLLSLGDLMGPEINKIQYLYWYLIFWAKYLIQNRRENIEKTILKFCTRKIKMQSNKFSKLLRYLLRLFKKNKLCDTKHWFWLVTIAANSERFNVVLLLLL